MNTIPEPDLANSFNLSYLPFQTRTSEDSVVADNHKQDIEYDESPIDYLIGVFDFLIFV